ncbi:MAG TPA: class I lanthipeptide [Thermoanaerobaculia bacterium]
MKKKDVESKLRLHKESIRCLTERELAEVEGAAPDTNTRRSCFSCDRTCTC